MKLVTYAHQGAPRSGVLIDDTSIVDATSALRVLWHGRHALDHQSPIAALGIRQILEMRLLEQLAEAVELVRTNFTADQHNDTPQELVSRVDDVRLFAPIPDPKKIIGVGLNYRSHAREAGRDVPPAPPLFAKYANGLIGHREAVRIPTQSTQIDYEGELAVIIGGYAHNVTRGAAATTVAGYSVFNDVSIRDYQRMTSQITAGKTFDTCGPCGPALVTADEVADPHQLQMTTMVEGEVLQSASTGDMIYDIWALVEYISQIMTLEPGDVIATGTPAGVGAFRDPPRWLQPGESVNVTVSGIGSLENPIVDSAGD